MDPTRLALLTLASTALVAITRALNKDLPAFRSLSAPVRGTLVLVGGALIAGTDAATSGTAFMPAVLTALGASMGSLVTLAVEAMGGSSAANPPGIPDSSTTATPSGLPNGSAANGPGGQASSSLPIVALVFAALAFAVVPGCKGGLPNVGPTVDTLQTYVEDAGNLIGAVEAAEHVFFAVSPNPAAQGNVEKAIGDARLALSAAIRALNGAKDITQSQLDLAFVDFKASWASLMTLATNIGIVHPAASGHVVAAGSAKGTAIPDPLVFGSR